MEKHYFLYMKDSDNDKDLEVHANNCLLEFKENLKDDLGVHDNCHKAVEKAKKLYPYANINGCAFCSNDCHTK